MKLKLILIAVVAFGSMAHAQGFASHLSIGAGFEGIFPGTTVTRSLLQTNSQPNLQTTTNSVGVIADARYDFGRHSAFDIAVTLNRDTEYFYYGQSFNTGRIQTNNGEIIGTYIARLPSNERLKPFLLFGGGIVRFSPNNNFQNTGTPSSQSKAAFAFGFGNDVKLNDRWALRLQYRGLVRSEPDFNLLSNPNNKFGTGLKTLISEPTAEIIYHF